MKRHLHDEVSSASEAAPEISCLFDHPLTLFTIRALYGVPAIP